MDLNEIERQAMTRERREMQVASKRRSREEWMITREKELFRKSKEDIPRSESLGDIALELCRIANSLERINRDGVEVVAGDRFEF